MTDTSLARLNMVESQVRPNGITDHRILDAMMTVKREDFVGAAQKSIAYIDEDISLGAGRYLIEPMALARMLQLAEILPDCTVLMVGAATGYGAAVVSHFAGSVVALECDAELVSEAQNNLKNLSNVTVKSGDLASGVKIDGGFDVIIVEGRIEAMPSSLLAHLKDGGRAVAVMGADDVAKCHKWTMANGHIGSRSSFDLSIPALPGFALVTPQFVF